jgi:GntR family transcriptional repressor for pyruvate dehydrogenase complex
VTTGPLHRTSAPAEVIETLQQSIRSGVYKPGERLPSERALSDELDVSRPTIREAIHALTALGILESRRGSGIYVAAPVPGELLRPLQFALELSEPTLSSLFEVRFALEPLAAGLAAERRDAQALEQMSDCVRLAADERASAARFVELDTRLHMLIVKATDNDLLHNLVASLSWLSLQSRELTVREPGLRAGSMRDHEAIVHAIRDADRAGAEAAMRAHLGRVWRTSRRIGSADQAIGLDGQAWASAS